ncbi:DUF7940 domain-containing protein [Acinetobacter baumannii]|uniref:DUF7940 domain-containing protein n=1 Tax=Acinetobacter calcoaceticus/baumannii complex TaxID=909768 RepID=UPI0005EB83E4|nr:MULTISPECIES: hypothetical protein [Acinetobacter calcoaceticus/baumannii complex]MCF4843654.1 hypothetical protein [Acinetobacter baumannii]MDA5006921.1 hypothetical protein [Acinetobacter baumannii]MDI7728318.1 hypothetical protein [Acinetobacter baumannii]MDO7392956.1 hypothetical protein [Acinetobacter baumannii]MDV5702605.1 hypothetical protein [Acinetobacter baumannii]
MNKKYSVSPQELSRRLRQQKKDLLNNKPTKIVEPQYIQGVHGSTMQFGVLVHNWQTGWKWFSNVAFAGIVAVQAFYETLPPELINALPPDTQSKITLGLAVLGLLGRFINQSKPKPLPSASDVKEDA